MKKALIPALACAIVLAACTGQKKMEPVAIGLKSVNIPKFREDIYGKAPKEASWQV